MKNIQFAFALGLLIFFVITSGCSRSEQHQQNPSPEAETSLRSAQSILESCARTGKRGAELDNYQSIIDSLHPTHRDMADILEKGFEELRTVKESDIKATAKRIMVQAQMECEID